MYIYIIKQVLYEFSIKPFSGRGFHVNIPNYIKNQDIQSWKLGIRSCFVLQNVTRTFVYIVINILQHIIDISFYILVFQQERDSYSNTDDTILYKEFLILPHF